MKKLLFISLAAVMMVLSAVALTSCGDDDSKSGTVLTGTTWEGSYEKIVKTVVESTVINSSSTVYVSYTFYENTCKNNFGYISNYSMSADNKTVYITVDAGTITGNISADGKTMSMTTADGDKFTMTKK